MFHANFTYPFFVFFTALFDVVTVRFGYIDIVVNNAGTGKQDLCIDLNMVKTIYFHGNSSK